MHGVCSLPSMLTGLGKAEFGARRGVRYLDRQMSAEIAFDVGSLVSFARNAPSIYAEPRKIASLAARAKLAILRGSAYILGAFLANDTRLPTSKAISADICRSKYRTPRRAPNSALPRPVSMLGREHTPCIRPWFAA